MAKEGYLSANLRREHDGREWDVATIGLLIEAYDRGSSSLITALNRAGNGGHGAVEMGYSGPKGGLASTPGDRGNHCDLRDDRSR